jgi:multidrug efflux pump subunit AcrB
MKQKKRIWTRLLAVAVTAMVLAAVGYVVFEAVRKSQLPPRSVTETRMLVTSLTGADFEVTDTHIDDLEKSEFVSVFVGEAGTLEVSQKAGADKKTLLFRYDPGQWRGTLPLITSSEAHKVQVSLPGVSTVIFERPNWKGISVDYRIGTIVHPSPVTN